MKKFFAILFIMSLSLTSIRATSEEILNEDVVSTSNIELEQARIGDNFDKEAVLENEENLSKKELGENLEFKEETAYDGAEVLNSDPDDTLAHIPDPIFKKVINNALKKPANHNPTIGEIKEVESLKIEYQPQARFAYIYDITGLELFVNLETLNVFQSFVPNEIFEVAGDLPNLKSLVFLNSNISGNDGLLRTGKNYINDDFKQSAPYSFDVNIGKVGKSETLETLKFLEGQRENKPNSQFSARGRLVTDGLENLSSLKTFEITSFADIEDKSVSFLAGMPNLEKLNINSVPVENLDVLLTLPNSTEKSISYIKTVDFSKLNDVVFKGNSVLNRSIILDKQDYTYDEVDEENIVSVNTTIVVPEDATINNVSVSSGVKLLSQDIIDGVLHLKFSVKDFSNYTSYDFRENVSNSIGKGFLFNLAYTTVNGVKITYNTVLARVKETVTFSLNTSDVNIAERLSINVPVNDQGLVTAPIEEDFGLRKHSIVEWHYNKELTSPVDFDAKINKPITVYAKLSKLPTASVIFNSNGGSDVATLEDVLIGEKIEKPIDPTKKGYSFVGWTLKLEENELNSIEWDFDQDVLESNITLFAMWKENETSEVPEIPVTPEAPDKTLPKDDVEVKDKLPKTGISSNNSYFAILLFISSCLVLILRKSKSTKQYN